MWSGRGGANGCSRPKGIFEAMDRPIVLMLIMLRVNMNIIIIIIIITNDSKPNDVHCFPSRFLSVPGVAPKPHSSVAMLDDPCDLQLSGSHYTSMGTALLWVHFGFLGQDIPQGSADTIPCLKQTYQILHVTVTGQNDISKNS